MPKAFLSYSRQDEAFVSQMESGLAEAKFDVWRDVHSLRAGDRWPLKLGDAIAAAPMFILQMRPKSVLWFIEAPA